MDWKFVKFKLSSANVTEIRKFVNEPEFLKSSPEVILKSANYLRKRGLLQNSLEVISAKEYLRLSSLEEENMLFLEGDIYHDLGKFEKCIEVYDKILKKRASDIAYNNRALAHWELGHYVMALADYIHALNINPENITSLRGAGEMSLKLYQYEEAEAFFKRALQLKSDYLSAYVGLGLALYHLGSFAQAEERFRDALALDPGNDIALRGINKIQKRNSR